MTTVRVNQELLDRAKKSCESGLIILCSFLVSDRLTDYQLIEIIQTHINGSECKKFFASLSISREALRLLQEREKVRAFLEGICSKDMATVSKDKQSFIKYFLADLYSCSYASDFTKNSNQAIEYWKSAGDTLYQLAMDMLSDPKMCYAPETKETATQLLVKAAKKNHIQARRWIKENNISVEFPELAMDELFSRNRWGPYFMATKVYKPDVCLLAKASADNAVKILTTPSLFRCINDAPRNLMSVLKTHKNSVDFFEKLYVKGRFDQNVQDILKIFPSKTVAALELESKQVNPKNINITLSQALHYILFVPHEKNPIKLFDHKGQSNSLFCGK